MNSPAESPVTPPVITIDGPAAAGKGTIAKLLAHNLGFHYLDSGKIYRVVAMRALHSGMKFHAQNPPSAPNSPETGAELPGGGKVADSPRIPNSPEFQQQANAIAAAVAAEFTPSWLEDADLERPETGEAASFLAAIDGVRRALLPVQRSMRRLPGLVADGRDMGTVVFPDAQLKVFLTADIQIRAQRRLKQLEEKQIHATITEVLTGLKQRDERDQTRVGSPLTAPADAMVVDSSRCLAHQIVDELSRLFTEGERRTTTIATQQED